MSGSFGVQVVGFDGLGLVGPIYRKQFCPFLEFSPGRSLNPKP